MQQQQAYLVKHGAQNPADSMPDGADPRDLRRKALDCFSGIGASRSYHHAYYFALLAEAAGDVGASAIRTEIDARFHARGQKIQEFWAKMRGEIQNMALQDWISDNLNDRYMVD